MSESKFFCFGKNDFCDTYNAEACRECRNMDGHGGEMRTVPDPHRLDRSAWEPCAWCAGKACLNCSHAETPSCKTCKTCKERNHWEPDSKFCQFCGRPRTSAAWEMLEKRLEGAK